MYNFNHINNAGNVVLPNSMEPGDKLGGVKITKHDDDKGRSGAVGSPTENGLSSYTNTDNTITKNQIYYETLMYEI
jgi:hypothetical protein